MHARWTVLGSLLVILIATLVCGCSRHPPPTPEGIDARVAPLPPPGTNPSVEGGTSPGTAAASSSPPTTSVRPAPPGTVAGGIDAGDPGSLPQTRDKPAASSPGLDARAAALWDAIAHDDPERAIPFFFPVTAYEQVKAIPAPAGDWRRRLVAAYKRDIHALTKRLGERAESTKFVRLEVPDERARWVEPNEESNKLGYWRVYGTRIVYETEGKERSFDISSLISWRGEWYVVHLTGFK
jgi:hypothetical protein